MNDLKTLEQEVERLLLNVPETRNNDMILYYEYCLSNWVREYDLYKVFKDSGFRKSKGLSVFESVSRARRKIQAEHPELAPTKKVKEYKEELEEEYRNYYGKGV